MRRRTLMICANFIRLKNALLYMNEDHKRILEQQL